MSDINISMDTIDADAAEISNASDYFIPKALEQRDFESTITANSNETSCAYQSQQLLALFGTTLDQDAQNIRSLGLSFIQYDEMLANLRDTM